MNMQENWIAFYTIFAKEVRRFMRIWTQTLLPSAITMMLYFLIFGSVIGSRIGKMGGQNYMTFVVPGLIMMAVITNSYGNVASGFFSGKFQKSVEEMLVAPVPNWIIVAGFIAAGVTRGLMVAVIVTVLSLFFVDLTIAHFLITLLVVIMTATMFSLGGFINAVYAKKFDDISIVPTFVLTPLTYLGGVFYSIDVLPQFWQNISLFNPILYQVNTFRFGLLGCESDVSVWFSFLIMSFVTVGLFIYSLFLLKRGKGLRS